MITSATVVGAGVAGLAMAAGLERLGCDVTVVERSPTPHHDGAGLTLWPNAMRALDSIGAGDAVRAIGEPVLQALVLRPSGRRLSELPIAALSKRYGPLLAVHRTDLTRVLAHELSGTVRYGTAVTVSEGRVLLDGEPPDTDLVVGADGIDSTVRNAFLPVVKLRHSGQFAARGVARMGSDSPAVTSETWGRGLRFGLVPLTRGLTYWFAVARTEAQADDAAATFARWHAPIPDVLAAPQEGSTPTLPLLDLPRLPRWHDGQSTVLVGDAAHAMTPNLGQGAAQAFEDVAVLLEEMSRRTVTEAFMAYERRRKHRVEQVVARSRMTGVLAQGGNAPLEMLRDGLATLVPSTVMLRQASTMMMQ